MQKSQKYCLLLKLQCAEESLEIFLKCRSEFSRSELGLETELLINCWVIPRPQCEKQELEVTFTFPSSYKVGIPTSESSHVKSPELPLLVAYAGLCLQRLSWPSFAVWMCHFPHGHPQAHGLLLSARCRSMGLGPPVHPCLWNWKSSIGFLSTFFFIKSYCSSFVKQTRGSYKHFSNLFILWEFPTKAFSYKYIQMNLWKWEL